MKLIRLDSSQGQDNVKYEGEQKITPLLCTQDSEKKEVDIEEYVNNQCNEVGNRVVAFIINWIKTTYTSDLLRWLKTEFKEEIIKELKK